MSHTAIGSIIVHLLHLQRQAVQCFVVLDSFDYACIISISSYSNSYSTEGGMAVMLDKLGQYM